MAKFNLVSKVSGRFLKVVEGPTLMETETQCREEGYDMDDIYMLTSTDEVMTVGKRYIDLEDEW